MIDEVTGLEMPEMVELPPAFIVLDKHGQAHSIHPSMAAAIAWIKWNHPGCKVCVEEI